MLGGAYRGPGRALACDAVVVVIVVMTVVGPFNVNELGVDEQVPPVGAPLQETVTAPLNPPIGARVVANVADCPGVIVAEFDAPGGSEIARSIPLPPRVIACGLPGALSAIVMAPARAPLAVGVKVMEIMQVPLGATLAGQLSVSAKSPLLWMLVIFNAAFPGFVSVTTCGGALVVPTNWSTKATLVVERLTAGPEGVPVPFRLTNWGLSPALSVSVTAPARVPVVVGVNVTLIVQLAPAARVAPQFVAAKSPLDVMLLIFSTAFPAFITIIF